MTNIHRDARLLCRETPRAISCIFDRVDRLPAADQIKERLTRVNLSTLVIEGADPYGLAPLYFLLRPIGAGDIFRA